MPHYDYLPLTYDEAKELFAECDKKEASSVEIEICRMFTLVEELRAVISGQVVQLAEAQRQLARADAIYEGLTQDRDRLREERDSARANLTYR